MYLLLQARAPSPVSAAARAGLDTAHSHLLGSSESGRGETLAEVPFW